MIESDELLQGSSGTRWNATHESRPTRQNVSFTMFSMLSMQILFTSSLMNFSLGLELGWQKCNDALTYISIPPESPLLPFYMSKPSKNCMYSCLPLFGAVVGFFKEQQHWFLRPSILVITKLTPHSNIV